MSILIQIGDSEKWKTDSACSKFLPQKASLRIDILSMPVNETVEHEPERSSHQRRMTFRMSKEWQMSQVIYEICN